MKLLSIFLLKGWVRAVILKLYCAPKLSGRVTKAQMTGPHDQCVSLNRSGRT